MGFACSQECQTCWCGEATTSCVKCDSSVAQDEYTVSFSGLTDGTFNGFLTTFSAINGDDFVLASQGYQGICGTGCCCWRLTTASDVMRNGSAVTVDILLYVCLVGSDYISRVQISFVGIGPFGTSPQIVYEHNYGTSPPDCLNLTDPAYLSTSLSPTSIASSSTVDIQ